MPPVKPVKQPASLTLETVVSALEKARGNVSAAARKLGVSRQTLHTFLHAHPQARTVVLDARAGRADLAEDKLSTALRKGEPWAIQYALSTLGRDRGYIVRLPDVVASSNLDALARILRRFGVEATDQDILVASMAVAAEIAAEKS